MTLGETGSDRYSDAGGEEVVPWDQWGTLPPEFVAQVFSTAGNGDPRVAAETASQHDRTSDIIESWSRCHTETAPDAQGVIHTTSNTTDGTDEKTETTHQTLLNGAGDPTDATTDIGTPAPGWNPVPNVDIKSVQSWNAVIAPPAQAQLDLAAQQRAAGYKQLVARHAGVASAAQIAAQIPDMQCPVIVVPQSSPVVIQGRTVVKPHLEEIVV